MRPGDGPVYAYGCGELRELAQAYFGDLWPAAVETVVRLAKAESGGNPTAVGDNQGKGRRVTLWRAMTTG